MHNTHNAHLATAMLIVAGTAVLASRKGPRARMLRRRLREFKDVEPNKIVEDIKGELGRLSKEAEGLARKAEVKDVADGVAALKADLKVLNDAVAAVKASTEVKDMSLTIGKRLDEIERKVNEAAVNSAGKPAKTGPTRYSEIKSLDEKLRAGGNIEKKDIPTELKPKQALFDPALGRTHPFLAAVDRRPTISDTPAFGYSTAVSVKKVGVDESATASAWKKATATVYTYEYQPTIAREDVADMGALVLDREAEEFNLGYLDHLDDDCVDAIEAAGVASDEIADEYTEVEIVETATADTIVATDIYGLIGEFAQRYKAGLVILGNAAMTATLRGINDAITGQSLWTPSLAEGVPARLAGYTYIESEAVADDRLIACQPVRAVGVAKREAGHLEVVERSGGDYKPYFAGRAGVCVKDARAAKILDIAEST